MTYDSEDDLFDEEFDFVDEDDDLGSELDEVDADGVDADGAADKEELKEKPVPKKKPRGAKAKGRSPRGGARKPIEKESRNRGEQPTARKVEATAESGDSPSAGTETSKDETPKATPQKTETEETTPAEPVGPPTDHVIHLYEFGDFTRTIPREFTSEDAEAFAAEYNRTSKPHSRKAVAAGKDEEHAFSVSRER